MMASIRYITHKILSVLLIDLKTLVVAPLVRVTTLNVKPGKSFYFDFSDATTHLGDRLFFMPLVWWLIANDYSVGIKSDDKQTGAMFENMLGHPLLTSEAPGVNDIVVYPAPSYLNLRRRYPKAILIDFTDCDTKLKVSEQLVYSMGKFLDAEFQKVEFKRLNQSSTEFGSFDSSSARKSYLFNNYVDSGRFRKFFINENKLLHKAVDLKRQGYRIIHVGSKQDKETDAKKYSFVDVDLRGETSIEQLINIVRSENVIGAVTYDNFIMHLIGIYGKVAFVLFRGRFFRKNREHHVLHINNTFFEQEDKLIYL